MRTAFVGLFGWAGFLAVTGHLPPAAAEPSPIPIQPPKPVPSAEPSIAPRVQQPPFIGGVRRTPQPGIAHALAFPAYSEGPMSFDVEIVNPTTAPITTQLLVERVGTAAPNEVARVPVSVAAGERAFVTFVDGLGLRNVCSSTADRLALQTEGSAPKTLRITPACSFAAEAVDGGLASVGGDAGSIAPAPRDRLTYHSASITTPSLACGGPLSVRAIVRNNTRTLAQGVRLRLDGPRTAATDPFDVTPNRELPVTTTITGFMGEAGMYMLRIDPVRPVETHQPGWHARVTRSCRLDVALER